ncbi:MAG: 1-deoxy-D-xylulose-5-phosphate reductoisomerase [Gammaproteobacteria bacterium CG22_combo_CG10-13_8_21_14_all_40_8]|nr:MAG: 1-deoxy-D-xylulose-5-phosphate reductoisomerase [Gammaproteobacteria bacterium CG22_combo_CG10-13_8_21_14_all_40_8]
MKPSQNVTILGSTGSIGVNTLDVIQHESEKFQVYALTANQSWQKLFEQIKTFKPKFAVCADTNAAQSLKTLIHQENLPTEILSGVEGLEFVASSPDVDIVMAGIVGAAGLLPTLAAVKTGKKLMLANKESLVMAGELFMALVQKHRALLLPVDSEHNALFQCLPNHHYQQDNFVPWLELGVEKLILTASGGPFFKDPIEDLYKKTPQQACLHPNWSMGRKISVDSATLMNKGLEVIEASYLYGIAPDRIEVVIHPQSIIHSMVSYSDGAVLAELGNPDMRTPIAHALGWPERLKTQVKSLDITQIAQFDFFPPDYQKFPCLNLAFYALKQSGTAPAILNAANEMAVEAFLNEELGFMQIAKLVNEVLQKSQFESLKNIEQILNIDKQTRQLSQQLLAQFRE